MKLIESVTYRIKKHKIRRQANRKTPLEKSLGWIKENIVPGSGIVTVPKRNTVTQEVTGYLIPTLYNAGEKSLARNLARWEASVQRADGSFAGPDHHPYTFDTAQVIRGFLTVLDDLPELESSLRRACDYVMTKIDQEGKICTPKLDAWKLPRGKVFSEYTNLYVLPPLRQAGEKLSEPLYEEAAMRAMQYFRRKPDLVEFKSDISTLSHIFGYMMEALVEMGEIEFAKKGLIQAAVLQEPSGAIPAYPGAQWFCSTGMAQLAVAWYKLGEVEPANKAMDYLERIQNRNGGFYGSYGRGAAYFPKQEISWAVKFFIDAYLLRIRTDFNREVHLYSEEIEGTDGRLREILSFMRDLRWKRVIDVGCGKGRYLRVLKERFPESLLYGIDLSEEMLKSCPEGVEKKQGTMLNIEYPDSFFDGVYSVEALEHAVEIESAIREMARVLKAGGKIVIIDKNREKLGSMTIKPWERWFDPAGVAWLLKKYGISAGYRTVAYETSIQPDGIFIAWEGVKDG